MMEVLQKGAWEIKRATINEAPVHPDEGYLRLIVTGNQLRIEPLGMVLTICTATPRTMMLESQSQIFVADVNQTSNHVQLKIERQSFAETIVLEAVYAAMTI